MLTHYYVIIRRNNEIVSTCYKWASSDREKAREAIEREAKKVFGDMSISIELH